jgi:hypothetical protein
VRPILGIRRAGQKPGIEKPGIFFNAGLLLRLAVRASFRRCCCTLLAGLDARNACFATSYSLKMSCEEFSGGFVVHRPVFPGETVTILPVLAKILARTADD